MRTSSWLAMSLLVGVSLLAGCGQETSYEPPPPPVRVHVVKEHSSSSGVRYSANIEPYEEVALAFKVGGYVEEILQRRGADGRRRPVQEGDRVAKGTVLARVRKTDYAEKVNQAKSQLAEAQAAWDKAKLDFDRASKLFASESITKPNYDAAKAQVEVAEAKVEGARALLEEAEIVLRDTVLKAPMSALIFSRQVEAGTLVATGTVGFLLADVTSVKAVFGVPDLMINRARLGSTLTITVDSIPGTQFRGRLTAISPLADPRSRVFEVELTVPNPRNLLKPGMIATVRVAAGEAEGEVGSSATLTVPLSAIVRPPGKSQGFAVFVVEEQPGQQVARLRIVKLGDVVGNSVAVSEGVNLGERVIVTGATLLEGDGKPVRVIP